MKKYMYKIIFIIAVVSIILPARIHALDISKTGGSIECTIGDDSSVVDKVSKNDVLSCILYVSYSGANSVSVIYPDDTSTNKITVYGLTALSVGGGNGNFVYMGSNDKLKHNKSFNKATISGNKVEIGNFRVKVTGDDAKITIPVKFSDDSESGVKDITKTFSIGKSSDASLKSLTIDGTAINLEKNKFEGYKMETNKDSVSVDVVSTQESTKFDITGNKSLKDGDNEIKVSVTAPDGVTVNTYKVTVTKVSSTTDPTTPIGTSKATLSNISINAKNIVIKSGIYNYSITVSNDTKKADISYITTDKNAKVSITGNMNLEEGDNQIKLKVSLDDEENIYTVNITRSIYNPKLGVSIPISIIFLGLVGLIIYINVKNKSYIQKI